MRFVDEDLEMEKNKVKILEMSKQIGNQKKLQSLNQDIKDLGKVPSNRYAWEFELLEYKKRKSRETFFLFGSILGIISFIVNIIFIYLMLVK
jgi:hypothetical protein